MPFQNEVDGDDAPHGGCRRRDKPVMLTDPGAYYSSHFSHGRKGAPRDWQSALHALLARLHFEERQ